MNFRKFQVFFMSLSKYIRHFFQSITSFFRRTKLSPIDAQLFSAVAKGHTEDVALFLARGANANAVTSFGFRPILTALAAHCKIEIFHLLLKHGADVNTVGWLGMTPMKSAISKYRLEIVALFLRHGANVNLKNHGVSALHFAVLSHNKSNDVTLTIVRMLIIAVLLENITTIKPDFISKNNSISTLWDESEIFLDKKLVGTISLGDFCKEKNENELALLSENEELKKGLKDLNLSEQYPYLNEKIQSQIQKGLTRNQTFKTALNSIYSFNANKELNEYCWKEILRKLPQNDLKNIGKIPALFFEKFSCNDSANKIVPCQSNMSP